MSKLIALLYNTSLIYYNTGSIHSQCTQYFIMIFSHEHPKVKSRICPWGTNNDEPNSTYETTDAQTKKNCNRGTALVRLKEHLLGMGGFKLVLFARSLTLNSDAAPNYKHMFKLHTGPLPHV